MADRSKANPRDEGGDWFVDTTCIDCDIARQVAPGLIEEDDRGRSYFVRAPRTDEEVRDAWRALLACPTGSIGAPRGATPPEGVLPYECAPGVQYLGYAARASFGANAYLVPPEGDRPGLMVDAPRWNEGLAGEIADLGGVDHVLLTHRDDVADFDRYADRFDARVWIHQLEQDAAPGATDLLDLDAGAGDVSREILPDVTAIHVPGHTRGSVCFLVGDRLFTGDSLYWSRHLDTLNAFPGATWYSWEALVASMERLLAYDFAWVLPGHGGRGHAPVEEMREALQALVERMRAGEVEGCW